MTRHLKVINHDNTFKLKTEYLKMYVTFDYKKTFYI
jgi:hypothetical protein